MVMTTGVRKIELPKIEDRRGNLSFIEGGRHIPFDIKRAYWIYDVPGGQYRGGHAYRTQQEFIVALSGSFETTRAWGRRAGTTLFLESFLLWRLPPGTYLAATDRFLYQFFGTGLVVGAFDESDYIYDFDEYKRLLLYDPPFGTRL